MDEDDHEITDLIEECDLCHYVFGISEMILTECGQLLCKKCNYEKN